MRKKLLFLGFLGKAVVILLGLLDWQSKKTSVAINDDEKYSDIQGEREHLQGDNQHLCWCHPDLVFEGGDEFTDVWIHKAPGEELPPSKVVASAIADAISGYDGDRYFPPEKET